MFDSFLDAIGRIGIFMICARAIVHFRPKEADEKYMKLLVSIMILIQLFLPLGGLLMGGGGSETVEALEQFKIVLEQSMQDAEENAAQADALLEEMTLEEVRKRMENQATEQQTAKQQTIEPTEQQITEQQTEDSNDIIEVEVEPVEKISVGNEEKNRE